MSTLSSPRIALISEEFQDIHIYPLYDCFGQHIGGRDSANYILSDILSESELLPLNGILIFDFKNIESFSFGMVSDIRKQLQIIMKKKRRGLFYERFLIFKDTNRDIRLALEYYAKDIGASLLILYTNNNEFHYEVINLHNFLCVALGKVRKYGPLNSKELEKRLPYKDGKKGTSAPERLRRLYNKGLVTREDPEGTRKGDRLSFVYKEFTLPSEVVEILARST